MVTVTLIVPGCIAMKMMLVILWAKFSVMVRPSEDLFITSKLWYSIQIAIFTFDKVIFRSGYHAPEDVEIGCKESLKSLQLEYLDLYLVLIYMYIVMYCTNTI